MRASLSWSRWCWIGLALGSALLGLAGLSTIDVLDRSVTDPDAPVSALPDEDLPAIAAAVAAAWHGEAVDPATLPARLHDANQGVYLATRKGGRLGVELWGEDGGTVWDGIRSAVSQARARVPAAPPDTLQLDLAHSVLHHSYQEHRAQLVSNMLRGVRGLTVMTWTSRFRLSPSATIARNQNLEDFIDDHTPLWQYLSGGSENARKQLWYETFGADQLLIRLSPEVTGHRMIRGNTQVDMAEVNAGSISRTVALQARWLQTNQAADGSLTYLYRPSREQAPKGKDNMIRRWMAVLALNRWAAHTDAPDDWAAATKAIEATLAQTYKLEGDLGVIEKWDKVKLGALALAAAALHTHRDAHRWAEQETALARTIDKLVLDTGQMKSWYRNKKQAKDLDNFYPGEALFYWAHRIADDPDPELLERYMRSFFYYRDWHLEEDNRNPAFVPWHTQAHFQVWQQTQDPELAAFIFEMNDWLLQMQQWENAPFPDNQGRFFKSGADWGPPHASSTGVYIEGLIDAWRLATILGDEARAESYRIALLRGSRSIMQLQFVDEIDTFYLENPQRVLGGVRTRVYDNEVRCDNVQHPMMGMLKMLQHMPDDALEP